MVAHWPLDEGSGSQFSNAVDPALDGFLLDDTVNIEWVDVVRNADGSGPSQGSAVEFSGDNSWIQTDFPGIGGNNPRTIACWIKTGKTGQNEFLGYGTPTNGLKWHFRVNTNAGNGVVGAPRTEYAGGQNVGTTPVDDSLWHHVAAVFPEGATMGQQIDHYVDGILQGKSGGDRAIDTTIDDPLYHVTIGMTRQSTTNMRVYVGQIADVRIYDAELSEDELLDLIEPPMEGPTFVRGDADQSGAINVTDGVFLLNFLFSGGDAPPCQDAGDSNDSGFIDIADGVYILNFLFLGTSAPPAPFESCGPDPTDDATDCVDPPLCV